MSRKKLHFVFECVCVCVCVYVRSVEEKAHNRKKFFCRSREKSELFIFRKIFLVHVQSLKIPFLIPHFVGIKCLECIRESNTAFNCSEMIIFGHF